MMLPRTEKEKSNWKSRPQEIQFQRKDKFDFFKDFDFQVQKIEQWNRKMGAEGLEI